MCVNKFKTVTGFPVFMKFHEMLNVIWSRVLQHILKRMFPLQFTEGGNGPF